MQKFKTLVFVSLLFLFFGCIGTKITSQKNTQLPDRHYERLLVICCFTDLELRQRAENKFCSDINRLSICECLKSYELFFPGKEYSADEVAKLLAENKIDGILTLQTTDRGVKSQYIPNHQSQTQTFMKDTIMERTTTTNYGGYSVSKPWEKYVINLFSILDNQVAWYATASSSGNAYTSWGNLIETASNTTVKKLINDGVIPQKIQK
jgi:hypothetical protein